MNSDDYAKRQANRDAEYEAAYVAWVDSLPEDERQNLAAQGLAAPCVQRHGTGAPGGDAADGASMSDGQDPALEPEPCEPDEPAAAPCDAETVHEAIRRVIAEILCHHNARLTAECIALVTGLVYSGDSMSDIARRHGITRAAVSKRCVELTELLDLPPSRAMRSLTARESYRAARIRSLRKKS